MTWMQLSERWSKVFRIAVDTQVFWRCIVKITQKDTLNSKFINLWLEKKFKLLISEEIHMEYLKAPLVNKKFSSMLNINEANIILINELLKRETETIKVKTRIKICRDPLDNKFIECAVDGKANFIVSADYDLLDIKQYGSIKILTVPEMMEILVK